MKRFLLIVVFGLAVTGKALAGEFTLLPGAPVPADTTDLRITRLFLSVPPLGSSDIEEEIRTALKKRCEGYDGAVVVHLATAGEVARTVVVVTFQCFRR